MVRAFCCTALLAFCGNAIAQEACCDKDKALPVTCTLTTEEMRMRKETVLASLKAQVVDRKELENGYRYTFPGTDRMVDELAEFIKTERTCCAFFSFGLTIAGDKSTAYLELTGPQGTKEMIQHELGL